MILRSDQPPGRLETDGPDRRVESRRIAEAGGLTQFGAHVHTLQPGWRASDAHWHAHEDELLYVLTGEVTVVEDEVEHVLRPGDAACWPAGVPRAHHVVNRSSAPCSWLIVGTRVPRDVVHYPALGRVLTIDGRKWRLEDTDGTVIREGEEA